MLPDIKNIPMIYKRVPFDPQHAEIMNLLQDREITQTEAAACFDIPGIGFHRSLWLLSLHCVEHKRHGQQTFVVPTGMQGALGRTSLAGVTVDDLRFPFPCFYFALPDYEREIWGGNQTQWHKVRGVSMWHEKGKREILLPGEESTPPKDDRGVLHVYIWGAENERSQHRGDDASLWTSLDLNEMHRNADDLESYLNRILRDPSREKVDIFQDNPQLADLFGLSSLPRKGGMRDRQIDAAMETLRIVFNALIYMDSEGAETEVDPSCIESQNRVREIESHWRRMKNHKKGKARKLQREWDSLPKDTVTWVGRSYRPISEDSGGGSGSPQRRHWVRGHWWPRRDTIRNRIEGLKATHASILREYRELKDAVATALTPEEASGHLIRLAFVRGKAKKADEEIKDLSDRLEAKRRWVKPYQKGSGGKVPESHTYVLRDP